MGERAGYRVSQGEKIKKFGGWQQKTVSEIVRTQWYFHDKYPPVGSGLASKKLLEELVTAVAKKLLEYPDFVDGRWKTVVAPIGDGVGCSALRDDLDITRLFPALVKVVAQSCYDSIVPDIFCDINNHGLFEIELIEWNVWQINHYDVQWDYGERNPSALGEKKVLGQVKFKEGEELKTGMTFEWSQDFEDF